MTPKSLPKIAFTYWSGDQLSYLHLLTIKSVHFFNPDTKIIIYTNKKTNAQITWTTGEHSVLYKKVYSLDVFNNIPNVEIIEIDIQKYLNTDTVFSDVHCADFVRIWKLFEHGGIWFDMDILFLKPFWRRDDVILPAPYLTATMKSAVAVDIWTGFLISYPQAPFLSTILKSARHTLQTTKPQNLTYQHIGPYLWTEEMKKSPESVYLLNSALLYPYEYYELNELFDHSSAKQRVTDKVIGIHWFNGAPDVRSFLQKHIHISQIHNPKTILEVELKRLFELGVFQEHDLL